MSPLPPPPRQQSTVQASQYCQGMDVQVYISRLQSHSPPASCWERCQWQPPWSSRRSSKSVLPRAGRPSINVKVTSPLNTCRLLREVSATASLVQPNVSRCYPSPLSAICIFMEPHCERSNRDFGGLAAESGTGGPRTDLSDSICTGLDFQSLWSPLILTKHLVYIWHLLSVFWLPSRPCIEGFMGSNSVRALVFQTLFVSQPNLT